MITAWYAYATDPDLIALGVSPVLNDDAPYLLFAVVGVVLSTELQTIETQSVRGFSCTDVAF